MKAVSLTALTLVFYLLLSSLLPVGDAALDHELRAALVETAVSGISVENKILDASQQPTKDVSANPGTAETTEVERAAIFDQTFSAVLPNTAMLTAPVDDAVVVVEQADAARADAGWVLEDPQLDVFTSSVINGQPEQVVGVYVANVLALPVLQQPGDQTSYVSNLDDTITQFSAASAYGTIGLLAHNYLSGERFFDLVENQKVIILHGDGHQEAYRINKIQRFQALTPTSVHSDFVELADPARTIITAGELFNRVYTTPGEVVFQTCIEAYGNFSWGRIFISAVRIQD